MPFKQLHAISPKGRKNTLHLVTRSLLAALPRNSYFLLHHTGLVRITFCTAIFFWGGGNVIALLTENPVMAGTQRLSEQLQKSISRANRMWSVMCLRPGGRDTGCVKFDTMVVEQKLCQIAFQYQCKNNKMI